MHAGTVQHTFCFAGVAPLLEQTQDEGNVILRTGRLYALLLECERPGANVNTASMSATVLGTEGDPALAP